MSLNVLRMRGDSCDLEAKETLRPRRVSVLQALLLLQAVEYRESEWIGLYI